MKFEQLKAFESVARLGTFTAAANELFITQPSLSRQIATLESELHTPLFLRGRRGAELNAAGRTLLPIARRMIADEQLARQEIDELAGLRRGTLRVGAPPTLCVSILAQALAVFSSAHPGIDLFVTEAGNKELVDELRDGQLDLALIVSRSTAPLDMPVDTELVQLLTEKLVVVTAKSSRFLQPLPPQELTLAQLAELPQVAFNRSYDLRTATDAVFAAQGLTAHIAVEGAQMDAVLRFVELDIGVAVVPEMVVAAEPALNAIPVANAGMIRTVNLALRGSSSNAAIRLRNILFELVAKHNGQTTDVSS